MHARGQVVVGVIAVALTGCLPGGDDIQPPRLAAITPARGAAGTSITLDGEHFCQMPHAASQDADDDDTGGPCDPGGAAVSFDVVPATIVEWTDTMIMALVPAGVSGDATVVVSAGGRASSGLPFVVTATGVGVAARTPTAW